MGFYHECDGCGELHPLEDDVDVAVHSALPARNCDRCGIDGCVDCISDETGLCAACEEVAEGAA